MKEYTKSEAFSFIEHDLERVEKNAIKRLGVSDDPKVGEATVYGPWITPPPYLDGFKAMYMAAEDALYRSIKESNGSEIRSLSIEKSHDGNSVRWVAVLE